MIATGPPVPIASMDSPVETRPILRCDLCSFSATNAPNLKRRYTDIHHQRSIRLPPHPIQRTPNHLPTCPYCKHTFSTWNRLTTHLDLNRCPARPTMTAPSYANDLDFLRTLEWGQQLLANMDHNWQAIIEDRQVCEQIGNICVICAAWHGRAQDMLLHYQREHPRHIDYLQPLAQQLIRVHQPHGADKQCAFCLAKYKQHHTCVATLQLGGLLHMTQPEEIVHCCMLCQASHSNVLELQQHLLDQHDLPTIVWNAARGSLCGEAVCRHCRQGYQTMNGLKMHVQRGRCPHFDIAAPPRLFGLDNFTPYWRTLTFDLLWHTPVNSVNAPTTGLVTSACTSNRLIQISIDAVKIYTACFSRTCTLNMVASVPLWWNKQHHYTYAQSSCNWPCSMSSTEIACTPPLQWRWKPMAASWCLDGSKLTR